MAQRLALEKAEAKSLDEWSAAAYLRSAIEEKKRKEKKQSNDGGAVGSSWQQSTLVQNISLSRTAINV